MTKHRKVARAVKKRSSNIEKVLVRGGAGFIGGHLVDTIMPSGTSGRVAAYVAQIMNSVASNFDGREINVQLDELQRLVNEANANSKNGRSKRVLVNNVDGILAMHI